MAYGLWLYKEIQGKHLVRLEIKKRDYQGQAIEIDALGKDSITLSMDGSNITDPIIGSTLSFAIIDSGQINTSDFFTPDATLYAVELYLDGTLHWSGYLTPDSYSENLSYRDTIQLIARDNLGRLNDFTFEVSRGLMNIEELFESLLDEVGCPQYLNWSVDKVATAKGNGVSQVTDIRSMSVNTMLFVGKTYREAMESILYGLGCQMRFRGLNNLLILNLSDLSTIQDGSAIFIEKSGHKEILPAWKNVTITQDYGLIENFFDGVLTEKESGSSTFYNPSEQVPTKWEGNLNFQNQYGWNTGIEDNQQESIYPALHEEDQDVLNGDYRAIYKTPIKATNATLSITMSLNNTLRRLRNVVFNSVSNLFVPQGKEKYQITFSFQVALRTPNGKVYIMTSNDWVDEQSLDFNHSFARWIKFLMPECVMADEGTWNKEQEVSIFVNSIPYDGELLLYIYPILWGEDGTDDGYSLAGKIRDIKIAFSNDIGQQSARATINDKHNITSEIALTIGQVPSGKGDYKAYAGGLFASDGLPIYGFKRRESDIISYNLMELVGREHIHYNKDNYTILSGRMMGDVSFGDNIAYKGRKYTLISASYSVISGILDVTSMQEVRDYQVAELTIIDSPLESTSGSRVGSGNNEVIQFSNDAGNAKRLYELQDATEQDQDGAYIIIDKSSMDSAKKLPISAISSALNKAFKVHYNSDGTIKSIEALANFWTNFGITAGGEGTGSGGGTGGATSLEGLNDVSLSALVDGQSLVWSSTLNKWINKTIDIDLSHLLSKEEAVDTYQVKGNYLTGITSKMVTDALTYTPLANTTKYAISDSVGGSALDSAKLGGQLPEHYATADDLSEFKTLFDSMFEKKDGKIHAKLTLWTDYALVAGGEGDGTGGSGGGGITAFDIMFEGNTVDKYPLENGKVILPAYPTTLPASDVSAWAKNATLAASDVPNLDWSKITSGKPTTLAGYGITDALSTSGGTITGTLTIKSSGYPLIEFKAGNTTRGYYGFSGTGVAAIWDTVDWQTLIHSGNIVDYALKNIGGASVDSARGAFGYDNSSQGSVNLPAVGGFISVDYKNYGFQLFGDPFSTGLYYRGLYNGELKSWKTIAFTDSNVASATKLSDNTAYTAWGQTFFENGKPKNVSGNIIIPNNSKYQSLHSDGENKVNLLFLGTDNNTYLGYGSAELQRSTVIDGNQVLLRYGSHTNGFILNSNGNVTIGDSDLASTAVKLYVSGKTTIDGNLSTSGSITLRPSTNLYGTFSLDTNRMSIQALHDGVAYLPIALSPNGGNVLIGDTYDRGVKLQVHSNRDTSNIGRTLLLRTNAYGGSSSTQVINRVEICGSVEGRGSVIDTFIEDAYGKFSALKFGYIDSSVTYIATIDNNGLDVNGNISASGAVTATSLKIGNGVIEWDEENHGFKVTGGLYTDSYLSAGGANTNASGGSGGLTEFSIVVNGTSYDSDNGIATVTEQLQPLITSNNKLSYSLISDTPTIPTTLKNPYALKFGSKTYDGSAERTIAASDLGLGNVENTKLSTWAGTSKITTLGTITTGTWNGTAIANAYLANSSIKIAGTSVSLGNEITAATLKSNLGLGSLAYKSSLAASDVPDLSGSYLPLSGGTRTITSTDNTSLILKTNGWHSLLQLDNNYSNSVSFGYYSGRGAVMQNGSNYLAVKDDGTPTYNGNTLIHSGNIGSYALKNIGGASVDSARGAFGYDNSSQGSVNLPAVGGFISVDYKNYGFQLFGDPFSTGLYYRGLYNGELKSWKTIAFTDSNVASATKLSDNTAYTAWGQTFFENGKPKNVSGNIIIPNNSKYQSLHSDGENKVNLLFLGTDNNTYLGYGSAELQRSTVIDGNQVLLRYGSHTNGFILNSNGNVTIGDSDLASTAVKLYVSGKTTIDGNLSTSGSITLRPSTNLYGTFSLDTNRMSIQALHDGVAYLPIALSPNGGNVLIGDTYDRGVKLQVHSNRDTSNIGRTLLLRTNAYGGSSSTQVINRVEICGSVEGRGSVIDTFIEDAYGKFSALKFGYIDSSVTYITTIDANGLDVVGNISASGAITAGTASDIRLKDSIQTIDQNKAIEVLMALNPITYQWNDKARELGGYEGISHGFIAQEYESIIPNSGRAIWKDYRAIDYTMAIPYIVSVEQNHEQRIKQLEEELKRLRREYYGI